ncbi:MAG: oligosaccharide flippase family protein, partial [Muribaculaceae bacterium]|nr:oligosaccharide flippase family protein [Muribaculaceae bacterium]
GVQAISILCSIVRTKLVALWLGPVGVGLISIFSQTTELFASTTQLNLRQSAVRDIASSRSDSQSEHTVGTVRVLSLTLGLLGMLLLCLTSPLVSRISFGDHSHSLAFVELSPVILLSAIAAGEWAVMQGLDRLKALARSTLLAALTATAIAIPLFYFFRLDAIVPVLVIFAACNCAYAIADGTGAYTFHGVTLRQALLRGRPMMSLGIYMTVSSLVTVIASYTFIIYLNRHHSTSTVGFYQAAYTLVNSYAGLIFTSISMEFFPRLTTVSRSSLRTSMVVSHEIMVAMWVLLPVVVTFICLRSLIVHILYTPSFDVILPYIAISILGVFPRAASWCIAYVMLARGDGRAYILTECISAVCYLAIGIPFFAQWGFPGLGAGYVLWYMIYLAVVYSVYRVRYGLSLAKGITELFAAVCLAGVITIASCALIGNVPTLAIAFPLSAFMAYRKLARKKNT